MDKNGKKDVLGLYIGESEGANFWLGVLTKLQNRGVKDILIAISFFGSANFILTTFSNICNFSFC